MRAVKGGELLEFWTMTWAFNESNLSLDDISIQAAYSVTEDSILSPPKEHNMLSVKVYAN